MFGEGNTARPIGPRNRGRWIGAAVGCLLLATGVVLVSGTVDGLNLFGHKLPDTTPSFSDPPSDPATDANSEVVAGSANAKNEDARSPARSRQLISTPSSKVSSAAKPQSIPAQPPVSMPSSNSTLPAKPQGVAPSPGLRIATNEASIPRPTPCSRSGYAAVLAPAPAAEPVSAALARSLTSSDLQTRMIDLGTAGFRREDADRILAGETPTVLDQIREGTVVVVQLKTQERRVIIDEAPMTEVAGTMDLAIVRNNCGTMTVRRHQNVSGRSVNERLDDGIRGLGEIFKEKIVGLVKPVEGAGKK